MYRFAPPLSMTDEQRAELQSLASSSKLPHRVVVRARALLLAADGASTTAVAAECDTTVATIRSWRRGFEERGLEKFGEVAPGRGRKATISQEKIEEIVHATRFTRPRGKTHWSTRDMAAAQGVSRATVQRIWSARGLKPHLVKTFKLSNDKSFEEKLVDVVGLYLNPPEGAVVLSVDEKSQCQALDRTQPSLPMKPGRAGTMTHDYKRNGTTTLFAALNILTGTILGKCLPRHRNGEFLKFLRLIDRTVPKGKEIHLILDNYSTHKHANVRAWLEKHPRFHLHFIPTSSSWLNLVERWFREITDKAIRRGSFTSVNELIEAINEFIEIHNNDPKPFIWTATADEIIEKVQRGRVALKAVNQN
ncbi:MAG TPA: IS630 family transposase [Streptomyces sp.]|nr:IS630 family transposase [Streptomyces sp.]